MAIFSYPLHSTPPLRRNIAILFGTDKLEWRVATRWWKTFEVMFSRFDSIPACDRQSDRQTDRQTSRDSIVRALHSIARAVKKYLTSYTLVAGFSVAVTRPGWWSQLLYASPSQYLCGWPSLARNQALRSSQPEPALCAAWNEYLAKAGIVNRHIAWHTSPCPWSRSVRWMSGCRIGLRRSAPTYGKRYRIRGVFATMRYTNGRVYFTFTLLPRKKWDCPSLAHHYNQQRSRRSANIGLPD